MLRGICIGYFGLIVTLTTSTTSIAMAQTRSASAPAPNAFAPPTTVSAIPPPPPVAPMVPTRPVVFFPDRPAAELQFDGVAFVNGAWKSGWFRACVGPCAQYVPVAPSYRVAGRASSARDISKSARVRRCFTSARRPVPRPPPPGERLRQGWEARRSSEECSLPALPDLRRRRQLRCNAHAGHRTLGGCIGRACVRDRPHDRHSKPDHRVR